MLKGGVQLCVQRSVKTSSAYCCEGKPITLLQHYVPTSWKRSFERCGGTLGRTAVQTNTNTALRKQRLLAEQTS
eukprot:1157995-Pelagomonas_calceolata.AAC.3